MTIEGLNGATVSLYAGDEPVPEAHTDLVVSGHGHTAGVVLPPAALAELTTQLSDALRDRRGDVSTVAGILSGAQEEAVAHFRRDDDGDWVQGVRVPGAWFVGEPDSERRIEVLKLGAGYVWSIVVDADGKVMGRPHVRTTF